VHTRLLIDVSRLMGRANRGRLPTGVDRVCLAYIAHFGQRAQAVVQSGGWRRIVSYRQSQALFDLLQDPGSEFFMDAARVIARACIPPWPKQDAEGAIYFNAGHSGLDDPGMAPWLRRTRQRPVFMVHDLIPLINPEYCRPGDSGRHAARLRILLQAAAGVLTNSKATLEDLNRFALAAGLAVPPVQVAPLAPAAALKPPAHCLPPLGKPYFVVVGTIEPRKNHWMLLHLWRELTAQMGADTPHLVVIGQRGWECENVVDMLERCTLLQETVHELPACSDAELARYLTHAQALLFPSFAEGYGMPLVEALMLRTPVIASNLPVFREIAGDVPEYLDPLDGVGWAEIIRAYAKTPSSRRAAQLGRLMDFQTPTWAQHFEHVEALLERLK
jgi:glycosyltransferase involved in cell wall biosynthesis